ncbi:MAG: phenylacetic acid degradation protein [Betaproteobacteria bacterium]|nr:phenylacetic acid degradation protein [Betaproteobacteria bacterium]
MKPQRERQRRPEVTAGRLNEKGAGHLPGLVGVEVLEVGDDGLKGRLAVRPDLLAPNGYLHAASVIALADTMAGYGTVAFLPEGARGFTTVELKSNFLGTARDGYIECIATPQHMGRMTQIWDAVITVGDRKIALFRCTQMILYDGK